MRQAAGLLRDPVLVLLGLILFFESGMEITVGGWTATYVNQELALSPLEPLVREHDALVAAGVNDDQDERGCKRGRSGS